MTVENQDEEQQLQADLFTEHTDEAFDETPIPLHKGNEQQEDQKPDVSGEQTKEKPDDQDADQNAEEKPASPIVGLSDSQFQQLLARQQQNAPELTREQQVAEIRKQLNPYIVEDRDLRSMGFDEPTPEQVAGFQNFINNIVKNAVSASAYMIKQQQSQFDERISPLQQAMSAYQVEQVTKTFTSENPDLAPYMDSFVNPLAERLANDPEVLKLAPQARLAHVAKVARKTLTEMGVPLSRDSHNAGGQSRQKVAPNTQKVAQTVTPSRSPSGPNNSSKDEQASIYS